MSNFPAIITIELRMPRTKSEAGFFGRTESYKGQAKIFVNSAKNRNRKELLDTLMHECYHAVVGMYKFSTHKEEHIARKVGKLVRST